MRKVLSAVVGVASILAGSAALACGAAPPPVNIPGFAGTAVAERNNSVSVFTASATGYSWDRLQLPSTTRSHIGSVPGVLTGSVETDARVTTGIAGENGDIIEFTPSGVQSIGAPPSTVFGAALSPALLWQVLTYQPLSQTLALISETAPGAFQPVSSLHADCGNATMLDAVVQDDGTLVGLCGGLAVELQAGTLALVKLPVPGVALARASTGTAVVYGTAANGSDLDVLSRSSAGVWTTTGTIGLAVAAQSAMAIDETSVLVKLPTAFTAFTLSNGVWLASSSLDPASPVSSAAGSPAQVYSGNYELILNSTDGTAGGAWTTSDLGALGTAPSTTREAGISDPSEIGCSTGIGSSGWALVAIGLMTFARLGTRSRRIA